MKISLCMIGKDEDKYIGPCLESALGVFDELVFVDTGSKDKTKSIVTEICSKNKKSLKLINSPWREDFSYHRNESFDAATGDWILWLDCDDLLSNASVLRSFVEEKGAFFDGVTLPYDYAKDEYGNVVVVHWRERVLRNIREKEPSRCAWKWEDKIHEYLVYPENAKFCFFDGCRVIHNRDFKNDQGKAAKDPERNIRILEKCVEQEGGYEEASPRRLVYLGNEYWSRGRYDEAIKAFEAYLRKSDCADEALQVHCKLSYIFYERGDLEAAYFNAYKALRLNAKWPDVYLLLAQLELNTGRFDQAIALATLASTLPPPSTHLILNPLNYSYVPDAIRYKAYLLKGDIEECLPYLEKALKLKADEDTKKDYEFVKMELERRKTVESVVRLSQFLNKEVISKLPDEIKAEPVIQHIVAKDIKKTKASNKRSKKRLAIYTGPHIESWSPLTYGLEGIGGSETAVINISEELTKLGVEVTVYGEPGPHVGEHGGVCYLPYSALSSDIEYDVFISSRRAEIVKTDIKAGRKVLWLHDVCIGDSLTKEIAKKYDTFMAVSRWQAQQYISLYEGVTAEKVIITGNGINTSLLEKAFLEFEGSKDPYKFIYSSSPDRGLEYLLDIWPDIKEKFPQATLDVFYGWRNFDFAAKQNLSLAALKQRILNYFDVLKDFGVKEHGRVNQLTLYKRMLESSWWIYPTNFCETSCITAQEVVACGVYPIVSDVAALPETLKGYGTFIKGSPEYPDVKNKFVSAIFDRMDFIHKNPEEAKKQVQEAASSIPVPWSEIANQWFKEFFS